MPRLITPFGSWNLFDYAAQQAHWPENYPPVPELIARWVSGEQTFPMRTSGSTGAPKTILLQREKIIYSAGLTGQTFGVGKGDTFLC